MDGALRRRRVRFPSASATCEDAGPALRPALGHLGADQQDRALDLEEPGVKVGTAPAEPDRLAELEASYLADTQLPGPELAGAGGTGVIDLAAEMDPIDVMLAVQTDREATRRREDAAESGRRRSTEVRLAGALDRVARGTYTYGQEPSGADLANWQGDGWADGMFSARSPVPRDQGAELPAEGRDRAGQGQAAAAAPGRRPGCADRAPVKAEIVPQGQDELVITLDVAELPVTASDAALKVKLPQNAGAVADGVLSMIGQAPVPGDPRPVRVVHVRLVRSVTVAETTIMLDGERQVWA